ncbi:hypothetical protein M0R45_024572 [Rubus argutus]|uniref:Uncharacterized protein n=1 Tax=Rubus argutus TaxID=59490 RepID=A0AAW1WUQ4_RUBAR
MGVATEAQVSWSGETHGGVDGCARLETITDWALIDAASWWRGEGGLSGGEDLGLAAREAYGSGTGWYLELGMMGEYGILRGKAHGFDDCRDCRPSLKEEKVSLILGQRDEGMMWFGQLETD